MPSAALERLLDIAVRDAVSAGETWVPSLFVESGGDAHIYTIVTDGPDRALALGRIRAREVNAERYVFAVVHLGEVYVEYGEGVDDAERWMASPGRWERISLVPSALAPPDVGRLPWSQPIPDRTDGRVVVQVVNHLLDERGARRTGGFVAARARHHRQVLGPDLVHSVIIDDRGQILSDTTYEALSSALHPDVDEIRYLSEG